MISEPLSKPERKPLVSRLSNLARLPLQHYLRIPAPIRILTTGIFINRAGAFVTAFLPLILAIRHVPIGEIGIALAMSAVFTVAGSWLGGTLISRLGTPATIFLSMTGSAIFTAALAFPGPYPLTLGLVSLISLFNRVQTPAAATMVGRLAPPDQRVQIYSFFQLCFNAGDAIGPAIAGYLLTRSLTALLLIDAATSACYGLVSWLRLPADLPLPPAEPDPSGTQLPRRVRDDHSFLLFCVAVALVFMVFSQARGPLPLVFKDHHYSYQLLGLLLTGNAIALILLQLPLSFAVRRQPPWVPLTIGAVLVCGAYALLLAGISVPLLVANVALWTIGDIVICPIQLTVATMMSTPQTHGRYQGALSVARAAGLGAGPALGVFAYSAWTSLPWLASGVIGIIAVGLFTIFLRRLPSMDEPSMTQCL